MTVDSNERHIHIALYEDDRLLDTCTRCGLDIQDRILFLQIEADEVWRYTNDQFYEGKHPLYITKKENTDE